MNFLSGKLNLLVFLFASILAFLAGCEKGTAERAEEAGNSPGFEYDNIVQALNADNVEEYNTLVDSFQREFQTRQEIPQLVNEQIAFARRNTLVPKIRLMSAEAIFRIGSEAHKTSLIDVIGHNLAVIGTGSSADGSIKFQHLSAIIKPEYPLVDFLNNEMKIGDLVFTVAYEIDGKHINSFALARGNGVYWDNVSYLIDFDGSSRATVEDNQCVFHSDAEGCSSWRWARDLGRNIFGRTVGTCFVKYTICWDCDRNFQNVSSTVDDLHCTSLPFSSCSCGFRFITGWGTPYLKVGYAGDYSASGGAAAMGIGSTFRSGVVFYKEYMHRAGARYDCGGGCNAAGPAAGEFDISVARNITSFLNSEDMDNSARALINLYIRHREEVNSILKSEGPKHKTVQSSFGRFWEAARPLISQSFGGGKDEVVSSEQVQLAIQFLNELEKAVVSEELVKAIAQIKDHIKVLDGKELKKGLKTFDKLDLKFAR